jgi:hypothetical protein
MIHTAKTVKTLQAVALTVGFALLLWSTGLPALFRHAEAASISSASDTLSSSVPSQVSNHTIAFTTPNGMASGETIELTFDGFFLLGSVGEDDVDIDLNGVASSTAAGPADGVWGVGVAGSVVTFTAGSGVASATPIVIRIGTNAVDSGTGTNQITNPATTTSYTIDIGGTMPDSGEVRVAIVDEVIVSASVDSSLTFQVSGVASGQTVNGSPTTTATGTTATTLPFGTLPITGSLTLAHDLAVTTNAKNGYSVTVEQTGALQSTLGATIDGFIDGSNTTTPTAWQGPSAQIADTDTYGHWGLTSEDGTTTRSAQFTSDTWVSGSTTPIVIMGHTAPADGLTAGIGASRIGYQIGISALQEAGDDYSTELRYIVTPVF